METKKTCSTCREVFDATADFFHRCSGRKDRLHNECKKCHSKSSVKWNKEHPENKRRSSSAFYARRRREVLSRYSNGILACNCCGEAHYEFLALDHINNNGNVHRKEFGIRTREMMAFLKKQGFPEGFQVLCHNCNAAKSIYGECPHVKEKRTE